MVYVLYNSSAGAHYGVDNIREKMEAAFPGEELMLASTISIDNKVEFVSKIGDEDKLVLVGGDGTLNRFVNSVEDKDYPFPIYIFAGGTGNDFINDVIGTGKDELVQINDYIKSLPVISVGGKDYKFLNGIGFGIDGWACEEGDKYREKTGKAPNYTTIALKGLLYKFNTMKARVTVDGVTEEFENVWMCPTMNGRYFGGGMMVTPDQDRLNEKRELSVVIVPCKSRLKLLTIFPKIFKGKHKKHTDVFKTRFGYDIKVEFDRPCALQIDGETVLGVTEYSVKSAAILNRESEIEAQKA
jgi:diacylglycerol kinase family enzyme